MHDDATICAIATPPGSGAISIIRVSGKDAFDICSRIIRFHNTRKKINELHQRFTIRKLVVDPWNARQLSSELISDGIEVVDFPQTMKNFTEPTKEFEALVKARKIIHNDNPVMNWMISNVMVETDSSGNYRPSKKKSTEKIDGVVAAIMALAVASSAFKTSVYETRELVVL